MTPLDFSGYVPGIVNNGPGYRPPTLIEICQALELQIKMLKKQLGDLSAEDFDTFKQTVNDSLSSLGDALGALQGDVAAIELALPQKEDKSNKSGVIDDESTDTQYPTSRAVYEALEAVYGDLADLSEAINAKADGNSTGAALLTAAIPYGECDSTSTATHFTATVPGITELKSGVCMLLRNGVVTSASGFTININGLGGKPSINNLTNNTLDTTIFNVAYTMLFIYDEDRIEGGCWICYRGYDANTNTIGYQLRTNSQTMAMVGGVMYRYRLMFTAANGQGYVAANHSSSTNATARRTPATEKIDPHGAIFYYGTTAAVQAGSRPAAGSLWTQYTLALGYSFNNTGSALTLSTYNPVYVKCTPQSDGSAVIDPTTPYVQQLPTSADGSIYIFLGVAYSATQIELNLAHPVYYHDGTAIRIWTGPIS